MKKKLLALAAFALLALTPLPAQAQPFSAQITAAMGRLKLFTTAILPSVCAPGFMVYDTTANAPKVCQNDGVTFATISGGGGGANTALSNLAAVSVNSNLLAQTGVTLGSLANPFNNIFLNVSGIYGTGAYTLSGTPTALRTLALADASGSVPLGPAVGFITFTGPTTSRSYAIRDAADTIMTVGSVDTITAVKTFNVATAMANDTAYGKNTNAAGAFYPNLTAPAPDAPGLAPGSTSNTWLVLENADAGFAFNGGGEAGTSAATDPGISIVSHNQDNINYRAYRFYGDAGKATKTLTESSATSVVQITVASSSCTGGDIFYSVFATDTTDFQVRRGHVSFQGCNKAGTMTCKVFGTDQGPAGVGGPTLNPDQTEDGSGAGVLTSGTLTYGWTSTTGAAACNFLVNAVSSLTQTTLEAYSRFSLVGPGQVLPQ